jgi:hypothetical protein
MSSWRAPSRRAGPAATIWWSRFDSLESDNVVTLQAMGAGTATLQVTVEDLSKEISVTVAGEEQPL